MSNGTGLRLQHRVALPEQVVEHAREQHVLGALALEPLVAGQEQALHPAVERDAEQLQVLLEVGQERLGALRQADVVERAAGQQVPLVGQRDLAHAHAEVGERVEHRPARARPSPSRRSCSRAARRAWCASARAAGPGGRRLGRADEVGHRRQALRARVLRVRAGHHLGHDRRVEGVARERPGWSRE